MVLHSGNHEIIGIRHRNSQTLYISHVIEPHSCSNPAYGKLQVGIYIAALQDAIDRAMQGIEVIAIPLPTSLWGTRMRNLMAIPAIIQAGRLDQPNAAGI